MSQVRGSGREYQTATVQERPRGATRSPRSGRGGRREEIPSVRGQGQRPGGATPRPHARGQGWRREELPGAMAAWAQEGLEELPHIEGQEGRW